MIELNKYILKSLKLPGVHIHPFPLLFWGIQRGVQPKLSALRLAPLEILRAKLSNQAAIQQRPAPLPVNHRLCCSSRSRDTVLGGFTDEWRGKSSCWNGAKNEFYSERKEQVKIWAVQVTYKSPSHYGDVKRVHTGSVCWGERRKNHVQPFDSLTFGAHLLLRLKPFFVSLLYIFCPSLTNCLMQSVKMWELETWQEIFSCPGLQDGKQRGDEPPVAGYYWVEMKFFNLSHLTMAAWNICFFFLYTVCWAFHRESYSLSQTRGVMWREADWLTLWGNIRDEDVSVSGRRRSLNVWWGQRWCESYAQMSSPTRRSPCHLCDSSRMYSTRFLIRPVDFWFRRLFSFKGCSHRHPAGRWNRFIFS